MPNVTLEEALSHGRGVERPFTCPEHDDNHSSASVNVVKGLWVCYACQANGKVEGWAPTADDLQRMLDRKDERVRTYPESWLDLFDGEHVSPYWATRYGKKVAAAFRCGTDPWTGMPTYPLRDAVGRVIGVVRRNDIDPEQPKYLYPPNVHTSRTLFGIERVQLRQRVARLVLVEGASDVLAIHEIAPKELVLGCYGAGLHAPQVQLIHQINPSLVVSGFDDDDAGRAATERAMAQLDGLDVVDLRWGAYGGTDAGSCEPESRKQALARAA